MTSEGSEGDAWAHAGAPAPTGLGPLSEDGFLGGRLRVFQPRQGYRATSDAVLMAAACPARRDETVLELGCGAGVAILCLGLRVPGLALAGLELQPGYADLARQNAALNDIALEVHTGDVAMPPVALRRPFHHVIANPPYFLAGAGTAALDSGRETARRDTQPLECWIDTARRRLRPGGWLTLVQRAERLPALLAALGTGFGSISVLPLAPRDGRAAERMILRARKGGRGEFRLLAPFVLHHGAAHDGDRDSYSPAARAVLRDAGAL